MLDNKYNSKTDPTINIIVIKQSNYYKIKHELEATIADTALKNYIDETHFSTSVKLLTSLHHQVLGECESEYSP